MRTAERYSQLYLKYLPTAAGGPERQKISVDTFCDKGYNNSVIVSDMPMKGRFLFQLVLAVTLYLFSKPLSFPDSGFFIYISEKQKEKEN